VRLLPPLISTTPGGLHRRLHRLAPDPRISATAGQPAGEAGEPPKSKGPPRGHEPARRHMEACPPRHFLTLLDLTRAEAGALLRSAPSSSSACSPKASPTCRWPSAPSRWCSRSRRPAPASRSRPAWCSSAAMHCSCRRATPNSAVASPSKTALGCSRAWSTRS
jgi:hypothetical protein